MSSGLVAVQTPSLIWLILLHVVQYNRALLELVPHFLFLDSYINITKSASSESVHAQTLVKLDQMIWNDPDVS